MHMNIYMHAYVNAGYICSMSLPVINRDLERQHLLALASSGKRNMALVTGRRRIGKTFLLTNMWKERPFFYFTAANTTGQANRRQLIEDFARHSKQDLRAEDYPTWRTVFREILRGLSQPSVIILDEFQYLAVGGQGLQEVASELNAVWEQPTDSPVLLVLSGSALTTMVALAAGGSPLYGRFNYQTVLKPFNHYYAKELSGLSKNKEAAIMYACFGGTPRYLAAYDNTISLRQNIERSLLSPQGEVRQLIETSLEQEEGLRDVGSYRAILDAVAGGLTERNAIAQRAGLDNDAGLRRRLSKLIELDYLNARQNFGAKPNAAIRYELADLAFRFQSYFTVRNRSQLDRLGPEIVYGEVVGPQLGTYVGKAFELIVRESLNKLGGTKDLPLLSELGTWEGADRNKNSIEIDLVARTFDGRTVTGEVKWNDKPVGPSLHTKHLVKLEALASSGHKWAKDALRPDAVRIYVSANGFKGNWDFEGKQVLLKLEDLYV